MTVLTVDQQLLKAVCVSSYWSGVLKLHFSSALSVYRVAEAGLHQWVRVELGPNTCYQQWAGWEVAVWLYRTTMEGFNRTKDSITIAK